MITVKHETGRITISGHAGYAPIGQDIVCAAFSAVLQTFVASAEELTHDDFRTQMAAGRAVVEYGHLSERGQLLVSAFFIGVRGIAACYPEHIKIVQAVED
jgi:uncharacterized protein YsxB (DUF464 family)